MFEEISSANALLGLRFTALRHATLPDSDVESQSNSTSTVSTISESSSIDEFEEAYLKTKIKGIRYRCRQCGEVKANHICVMLEEIVCRNTVGTQVEPVSCILLNPVKTITVRKSGEGKVIRQDSSTKTTERPKGIVGSLVVHPSIKSNVKVQRYRELNDFFLSTDEGISGSKNSIASSSLGKGGRREEREEAVPVPTLVGKSAASDHQIAEHRNKNRKLEAPAFFMTGPSWFGGVLPSGPEQTAPPPPPSSKKSAQVQAAAASWIRSASSLMTFSSLDMGLITSGFSYSASSVRAQTRMPPPAAPPQARPGVANSVREPQKMSGTAHAHSTPVPARCFPHGASPVRGALSVEL